MNTEDQVIQATFVNLHISPASTHSSFGVFLLGGYLCLPPHHHSEAFCDWVTNGSTTACLGREGRG